MYYAWVPPLEDGDGQDKHLRCFFDLGKSTGGWLLEGGYSLGGVASRSAARSGGIEIDRSLLG